MASDARFVKFFKNIIASVLDIHTLSNFAYFNQTNKADHCIVATPLSILVNEGRRNHCLSFLSA